MSKKQSTPLVAAAEALEESLGAFDGTLADLKRLPLKSKKSLERAASMLNTLGDIEAQISAHIQLLVKAIGSTGEVQLGRINDVRAIGELIQTRTTSFQALTAQLEALGAGASALSVKLQEPKPTVVDVVEELGALTVRAEALQTRAKNEGFDDVVHLADGFKQQLNSLQGKLVRAGS